MNGGHDSRPIIEKPPPPAVTVDLILTPKAATGEHMADMAEAGKAVMGMPEAASSGSQQQGPRPPDL